MEDGIVTISDRVIDRRLDAECLSLLTEFKLQVVPRKKIPSYFSL